MTYVDELADLSFALSLILMTDHERAQTSALITSTLLLGSDADEEETMRVALAVDALLEGRCSAPTLRWNSPPDEVLAAADHVDDAIEHLNVLRPHWQRQRDLLSTALNAKENHAPED